jgi:hypothetical protein
LAFRARSSDYSEPHRELDYLARTGTFASVGSHGTQR